MLLSNNYYYVIDYLLRYAIEHVNDVFRVRKRGLTRIFIIMSQPDRTETVRTQRLHNNTQGHTQVKM